MPPDKKFPTRKEPLSSQQREDLSKRWREQLSAIDRELRDKGLTEAEREALVIELMNEGRE